MTTRSMRAPPLPVSWIVPPEVSHKLPLRICQALVFALPPSIVRLWMLRFVPTLTFCVVVSGALNKAVSVLVVVPNAPAATPPAQLPVTDQSAFENVLHVRVTWA